MRNLHTLAIVLMAIFGHSCSSPSSKEDMASQMKGLRSEIDSLSKIVTSLQIDHEIERALDDAFSCVMLTPGSQGSRIFKTEFGFMSAALDNIEPYGNGTRVTLRFGNLQSASFDGIRAKIKWGPVDGNGNPLREREMAKDYLLVKILAAGSWTSDQVVLGDVSMSDLGYIEIGDFKFAKFSLME